MRRSRAGGNGSPKNRRKNGSSIKGNCCGARARDSVLIVTTDAETRLTTSAYEVRRAALVVVGGGAAGAGRLTFSSLPQPLSEIREINISLLNIEQTMQTERSMAE